jgi:DNA replication and repair protein RecF
MITDIHLQNFRSYKDSSFELSQGVNIIVGPNASGKTNLLEAILMVTRGSSYRAKDIELVRLTAPWAKIEAHTNTNDTRIVRLEMEGDHIKKSYKINDQVFHRMNIQKSVPVVIFEPNHLQLLHGSPELRRLFLDDLLEQTIPEFGTIRRRYKRVLSQRNSLLKKGPQVGRGQLFVWNIRLSELGEQIVKARQALVDNINEQINMLYSKVSHTKTPVHLTYRSRFSHKHYGSELLSKLESHEQDDFDRGFTSYGPHREDMDIFLKNQPAQITASRGETRTILLIFKVIEAEIIEQARGVRPVLLLDDVFSELDVTRRQALTQFLQPYQTFITTTDADVVVQHFTQNCNIIPVTST